MALSLSRRRGGGLALACGRLSLRVEGGPAAGQVRLLQRGVQVARFEPAVHADRAADQLQLERVIGYRLVARRQEFIEQRRIADGQRVAVEFRLPGSIRRAAARPDIEQGVAVLLFRRPLRGAHEHVNHPLHGVGILFFE
ncbi:hypothetical protein G6F65_022400 [Rhizopus arrhizus]|nr:hypothetical protein G6F65_022400 [Rhizopus arrhizus]